MGPVQVSNVIAVLQRSRIEELGHRLPRGEQRVHVYDVAGEERTGAPSKVGFHWCSMKRVSARIALSMRSVESLRRMDVRDNPAG